MLGLINHELTIHNFFIYAKDAYEAKYQSSINKRESTGIKYLNDFKAFIKYSNNMNDICKIIEECDPNKKRKILIVFDDMIADMFSNTKRNLIKAKLITRG